MRDVFQLGSAGAADPMSQAIGVIGDSTTKMNGNGPTLVTNALVGAGWQASKVQVDGVYGLQIEALSGSPQTTAAAIVNGWRASGFDPKTWLFATGINDKFATSSTPPFGWDSIRGAAVQDIYNLIMSGPRTDYQIFWMGFDFAQTTYSREPEATTFDQTLQYFVNKYGNFRRFSMVDYYAPLRSNSAWGSWWVYPTDEDHNTDLGYQTIRAPAYAQAVGAPVPVQTAQLLPTALLTDTSVPRDFTCSVDPSTTPGVTLAKGDYWSRTAAAPAPSPAPPPVSGGWSATNPPWALKSGETVDDNMPTSLAVLDYASYSGGGSLSLGATLAAARSAATGPFVLRLPAGTFHFTDFSFAAGTGTGHCYQDVNSTKRFAGIIGAGADKTFVVVDPSILTSAQVSGIASGSPSPVAVSAIYTSSGLPMFFSGITFRGNFQQTTTLSGLSGTAPAPYAGLHVVNAAAGSRIQFCRFQGFGFAAKSSPPYELGMIESSHSTYVVYRTELDGRLAPEINTAQPVSSGGLMWNYENNVSVVDSWLHHTRRSGFAMHEQAPSEGGNTNETGVYLASNFQVEHTADTTDSLAGSGLGFAPSNVEEMRNTFTYVGPRFTSSSPKGPQHLNIATSYGNTMANAITISDPVIGDTAYNGCLVVNFVITPNSDGTDPYYTAYQSGGFSALPLQVTAAGKTLTPVLFSAFNPATHTPDAFYLVRFA